MPISRCCQCELLFAIGVGGVAATSARESAHFRREVLHSRCNISPILVSSLLWAAHMTTVRLVGGSPCFDKREARISQTYETHLTSVANRCDVESGYLF